jgi:RNA recognition motif-containing protein
MPAPQGPPPPGKKTKKEKQRERKAAAGTTAVLTAGQKVGEAASQKRRADSGSDDRRPAKAAKTEEAANAGRRLFVGHCPQSLTEDGVRKLFETCGDCDVEMVQRPNGRFKGICFVTFETAKAATAALKLNGSELDGKNVVVQLASAPTKSKEQQPEAAPSPSVFVANLTAGTDKAAVRGAMREFGTIKGVTLIQKAEAHAAFVDFETTEEASKAVAAKSFARPLPVQPGPSSPPARRSCPRGHPSTAPEVPPACLGCSLGQRERERERRAFARWVVWSPGGWSPGGCRRAAGRCGALVRPKYGSPNMADCVSSDCGPNVADLTTF